MTRSLLILKEQLAQVAEAADKARRAGRTKAAESLDAMRLEIMDAILAAEADALVARSGLPSREAIAREIFIGGTPEGGALLMGAAYALADKILFALGCGDADCREAAQKALARVHARYNARRN